MVQAMLSSGMIAFFVRKDTKGWCLGDGEEEGPRQSRELCEVTSSVVLNWAKCPIIKVFQSPTVMANRSGLISA